MGWREEVEEKKMRTVRMVVVMDVKVRPNNWNHRHIEGVIDTLIQALTTSAQHPQLRNIDIAKYKVWSYERAYNSLLGLGTKEPSARPSTGVTPVNGEGPGLTSAKRVKLDKQ